MPSDPLRNALSDIQRNIGLARTFVANMSFEAFRADERTVYAVTRCLEIISEASRKLPAELKARYPEIPWGQVAGAGNVYRHDYEDISVAVVWDTVQGHLDALATAVERELAGPSS
jgi:uncharacterized protein with HEPN domain